MKKITACLVMLSIISAMTACGSTNSSSDSSAAKTSSYSATTASEAASGTGTTAASEEASKTETTTAAAETTSDSTSDYTTESEKTEADTEAENDTDLTAKKSALVGDWYYEEQDPQNGAVYNNAGFVTINSDSTYTFQPSNGSELKKGTIKVDYDEYADGSKVPYFSFYEDGGTFWNGIYCGQNDEDVYYFGNGGVQRLVRKTSDENPFEEYIGTWQADRCTIRIGELGVVEIHWADSASEDNVWEYGCIYSEDGTYMECAGGGTLTHIVTAEDGTETRTVIYNDGTAKFTVRGGTLFWEDGKENKGAQMGFQKIS